MLSFPPSPSVRIFVGRHAVDMRKGFDGLSGLVIDVVDEDPQSGHLFVFFNKRRDRMKALVWDGSGYWVLYKRLEHGRFQVFDRVSERSEAFELTSTDLALLLDGIDLRGARRRKSHDELMAS
ncbi:MAG: IS66 family insertion sequence element accessory protein TnpB [Planctomycetes bacterium]|nr:IS66 family insertion sequence element accessory protein TnpB [Planctomycetota bacterium]